MYYTNKILNFNNSIFSKIKFNNISFIVKRDDLICSNFSGNKARKAYFLFAKKYEKLSKIISYGSIQSNAMYSLSYYCKVYNKSFDYYVKYIPDSLKYNPESNYKYALKNGINIIEGEYDIQDIKNNIYENELFLNEGISEKEASIGIEILAKEIISYKRKSNLKNLKIFLPSGTGTTALFLQKYLIQNNIVVYTTNCVGTKEYLIEQFRELESNKKLYPIILTTSKKYGFGKLYLELYELHKELLSQTGIEFDFLYDLSEYITSTGTLISKPDCNSICAFRIARNQVKYIG